MSRPGVTIIMPTYNREAWLRPAMESVLHQDYEDLELLVIDDGSTDRTPEVLRDFERRHDPTRFHYLIQENAGQAAAINRGWELARGELMGYLSDDDRLAPGAVGRLADALTAAPEAAIAFPAYHMIDDEDRVIDTIRPIEYSAGEAVRLHDTIIGPGALMRRRAVAAAGQWDGSLRWIGDLILWLRITRHGPAIRVPEPLAFWRRHAAAATAQVSLDHAREHVRVAELGLDLLGRDEVSRADQAEALRNACILGSFFGGDATTSPGNRFAAIDLQRPEISAFGAGIPATEVPDERADTAARLWRSLGTTTSELAHARSRDAGDLGGLEQARSLLENAGVLQPDQAAADVTATQARTAMMEAALHCGRDSGIDRNRFLLLDRTLGGVTDDELDELNELALRASPKRLEAAIERRAHELARLRHG